jgi:hypothetical protein
VGRVVRVWDMGRSTIPMHRPLPSAHLDKLRRLIARVGEARATEIVASNRHTMARATAGLTLQVSNVKWFCDRLDDHEARHNIALSAEAKQ